MKVLIACEESQTVCKAFRELGHEAYSCDILPCSGGHPEWHIQDDVLKHLDEGWDLMIAHPPCTHLCVSGMRWFSEGKKPIYLQKEALLFVRKLMDADINKIAVENPVSIISSRIRKPDQIIKPTMFGEDSPKRTCLWLKNLPKLNPTNIIEPTTHISKSGRVWDRWFWDTSCISDHQERSRIRSKTFKGIANAMANQWGGKV
jgi:hypothetical protein